MATASQSRGNAEAEAAYQAWKDSQSGYIGKTNKAKWWENYEMGLQNTDRLNNLTNPNAQPGISLSGSAQENRGRLEGLERAKILTGQDPYSIGKDYQQAYGNIKKRSEGTDTGSEVLRASKAGAVADARNQMQQQGVKGGAAMNAVSQVERAKAYDVNNMQQQNQRQAEMDYLNATKSNANFTQASEMNFGAMALGKDVQAPQNNGTVICTELHRQGILSDAVMKKDADFGEAFRWDHPEAYLGYRKLADPIVTKMQKSARFTKLVAFFAVPWSKYMAEDKSFFGSVVHNVGFVLCLTVGLIIKSEKKHA